MVGTDNEYRQWLIDLKTRIRQSQIKAAIRVNTELLRLYWGLGHDIVVRQMEAAWGSGFFDKLSKDLRKEFPDMKGFSVVNLTYCKRFYLFYTQDNLIFQQLAEKLQTSDNKENEIIHQVGEEFRHQVGEELENHPIFQIPWFHHVQIFTKCQTVHEALFYVQKTIDNGWSRAVLMNFLEADLYSAQGKALNNFSRLLPEVQSDLAKEIMKDTYHEAEYAGKLGLYISAINHQRKKENDNPTIGLIICKTKDNVEVQYSLEIINQPIGVSEYKLSKLLPKNYKSALPSIEDIERQLKD